MKLKSRIIISLVSLIFFVTPSFAAPIQLVSGLTHEWYEPSLGISFDKLIDDNTAYFVVDGLKYSSFSFKDLSGANLISSNDLFLIFSEPSGTWSPKVVTYPSIRNVGQSLSYEVSWSLSQTDKNAYFTAAQLGLTEAGIGLDGGAGSIFVNESITDDNGGLLGNSFLQFMYDGTQESLSKSVTDINVLLSNPNAISRTITVNANNAYIDGLSASTSSAISEIPLPSSLVLMVSSVIFLACVGLKKRSSSIATCF
ncbi:MAG: hypothetical protein EOM37_05000 [Proteobacteria bacterium]|nr:hypothetical protein [Pseudomonadota bacterium]